MKFIITGRHSSGKQEVIDALEKIYNIKVGHEFSTLPEYLPTIYMDKHYEKYSQQDVCGLFENNAYLYISGIDELNFDNLMRDHMRGITQKTYDNSSVLILTPQQLVGLNKTVLRRDPICIVWLDNNLNQRINRYTLEERTYNFEEQENIESEYDKEFMNTIYDISKSKILYFYDEDPQRVALIIKVLIEQPQYTDEFIKIFK